MKELSKLKGGIVPTALACSISDAENKGKIWIIEYEESLLKSILHLRSRGADPAVFEDQEMFLESFIGYKTILPFFFTANLNRPSFDVNSPPIAKFSPLRNTDSETENLKDSSHLLV